MTSCVKTIEGVDETLLDKLIALGIISVLDLEDVGAEPLVSELNIAPELAGKLVIAAAEEARRLAAESKQKQAEDIMQKESKPAESKQSD